MKPVKLNINFNYTNETLNTGRAIVKVYCTHFSFRIGRINRSGFIRDSPTIHRDTNYTDNINIQ